MEVARSWEACPGSGAVAYGGVTEVARSWEACPGSGTVAYGGATEVARSWEAWPESGAVAYGGTIQVARSWEACPGSDAGAYGGAMEVARSWEACPGSGAVAYGGGEEEENTCLKSSTATIKKVAKKDAQREVRIPLQLDLTLDYEMEDGMSKRRKYTCRSLSSVSKNATALEILKKSTGRDKKLRTDPQTLRASQTYVWDAGSTMVRPKKSARHEKQFKEEQVIWLEEKCRWVARESLGDCGIATAHEDDRKHKQVYTHFLDGALAGSGIGCTQAHVSK